MCCRENAYMSSERWYDPISDMYAVIDVLEPGVVMMSVELLHDLLRRLGFEQKEAV